MYTHRVNELKQVLNLWHGQLSVAEKLAVINLLTLLYRKLLTMDPSCDPVEKVKEQLKITDQQTLDWFLSNSYVALMLIDGTLDDSEIHKYGMETGADIMQLLKNCCDNYLPF